jgi:uncharacterized protein
MIIDIHTHLGDILNPGGGNLIYQENIRKQIGFDMISFSEFLLHSGATRRFDAWLYEKTYNLVTRASIARNATATLSNMQRSMDESGITWSACMPIPPYLTFGDLKTAKEKEDRIIPFTGVDYTRSATADDLEAVFAADVAAGAKGLKLHPIIQRTPLTDARTLAAVEAFAVHRRPILFHCGISSYYIEPEPQTRKAAALGGIAYARELVAAFPDVAFIAGHAGLFQYRDVIELLSPFKNVMVDTSFQAVGHVRELIRAFGPERVMFASDWPFGNRPPAIRIIQKACRGDKALERRIFYENAAGLLGIS